MMSNILPLLVMALFLSPIPGRAQAINDYSPWIGREPQDLRTLLKEFDSLCQRRYLPEIEKIKKPFDAAQKWNQEHCQCLGRFLNAKQDPLYIQIVNLKLKDQLQNLPDLPPELAGYLDGFAEIRPLCQKNPKYVSPAEIEYEKYLESQRKPGSKPGLRSSNGETHPPHGLPYRPQKTPPGRD